MTTDDLRRASQLLSALTDAKDWRETFEANTADSHSMVGFDDIYMAATVRGDDRTLHGFEGGLELPRGMAIAMMKWLEATAAAELKTLGVDLVGLK